jgi:ATP-grasp domain
MGAITILLILSTKITTNIPLSKPMVRTDDFEHRKRPVILLAATLWWPLSTRMAIRFLRYGCQVSAICPKGHLLRHVQGLDTIFPYRALNSLSSLEAAIRQIVPDIIIPCDDRVVWQLHELHRLKPDLRPLIEASLGAADGFERVERRDLLLETARALGICIPTTKCATSEEEIHSWFAEGARSAVLKLDGTWGGEGVAIAHSEQEAIDAFRRFSQPTGIATAVKRLLVNREPLSLSSWGKQAQPAIILQQLIEGWPANSMVACWEGEVLSMVSVEVLASQGATGAAFLVRMIECDDMTRAAHLLAKRLQLNGFFGLDFQVDRLTGQPHLIEMNPRCTQLGHLPLPRGTDLAGALCAKLSGEACVTNEASVEGRVVAFFPQAGLWNSKSTLPSEVYNDIPQGQPELVRELVRPSWPERQWISRIYHLFRPPQAVEPTSFRSESSERAPIS